MARPLRIEYCCPEGEELKRRNFNKKRQQFEYMASMKTCGKCHLLDQCTHSKTGRSLKRHLRQNELDIMLERAESKQSKKDIRKRQHVMERSFARSSRYGFKRARWRRLWRVKIQELLTATVQNILVYVRYAKDRKSRPAVGLRFSAPTAFVNWYRRNLLLLRSRLNRAHRLVERAYVIKLRPWYFFTIIQTVDYGYEGLVWLRLLEPYNTKTSA